jgi:hypothetical protein
MSDNPTPGGFTGDPAAALAVTGSVAVAATRRHADTVSSLIGDKR